MKTFVNIIRGIIISYLVIFALIQVVLFTKRKIYKEPLPTIIDGYSYIIVKGDGLSPEIKSGKLVIFEKKDNYEKDDYIIYQDGEKYLVAKVLDNDLYKYKVLNENNETISLEDKDLLAKVIYNNDLFSSIIKILINPIMLVILLFIGTIFPEFIFNK